MRLLPLAVLINVSVAYADDSALIKARIVLDYPNTVDINSLKHDLKDAVKFRATDKLEEINNFMPDDLPSAPGDVTFPEVGVAASSSMFSSMISNAMASNGQTVAMSANMKGAVYGVKGYASYGFMGNKSTEGYVGAIYPYEKGYRVYLYSFFNKTRDMIGKTTDWLVSGVLADSLETGYANAVQVRDKLVEANPNVTIKRQDPSFLSQYKLSTANTVVKIESQPTNALKLNSSSPTGIQHVQSESQILK